MIEKYMDSVRNHIYKRMGQKDWSMKRTAIECGISPSELELILSEKRKDIRLSTLICISSGVGTTVSCLIGEEE